MCRAEHLHIPIRKKPFDEFLKLRKHVYICFSCRLIGPSIDFFAKWRAYNLDRGFFALPETDTPRTGKEQRAQIGTNRHPKHNGQWNDL